jgi:rhodanese-related sulfurtransferase
MVAIWVGVLVTGCEPTAWLFSARTISPGELNIALRSGIPPLVLDLRESERYLEGHVLGAKPARFRTVYAIGREVPLTQDVVLICEHGRLGALAISQLRGSGHARARVLEGGIEAWRRKGLPLVSGPGEKFALPQAHALELSWVSEFLTYCSGVVLKPTYMLLSLGIILWIRRNSSREIRLIRNGLGVFLAGESACLMGFYLSNEEGIFQPLELLHGLGMAVGIGLAINGLILAVGQRMFGLFESTHACPLLTFCGKCNRSNWRACGLEKLISAGLLLLLPLCALPWTKELSVRVDHAVLFGTPVEYRWAAVNLVTEFRSFPLIATLLLGVGWFKRRSLGNNLEKGLATASFGLGFLSFSLFRFFLASAFLEQPYYSDFWEELSELLTIGGLALFLFQFHAQFGLPHPFQASNAPAGGRGA